jgi:hypothetical protein
VAGFLLECVAGFVGIRKIAAQLNFLCSNTVTEARQCKDFRNLIHPGRVLAAEAECNRGTAFSAVAALDFVVIDLARS